MFYTTERRGSMPPAPAIQTLLTNVRQRWGDGAMILARNLDSPAPGTSLVPAETARAHPLLAPLRAYLRPGEIVEISGGAHSGKSSLALALLAALLQASGGEAGLAAYVDTPHTFYPPSAAATGIDLGRLWVVRLGDWDAHLAAVELLLRAGALRGWIGSTRQLEGAQEELIWTHEDELLEAVDRKGAPSPAAPGDEQADDHPTLELAAATATPEPDALPRRRIRVDRLVYRSFLLIVLIGEFPLNAIAFRLFGEAAVFTWIMTLTLAVSLVACAHGLGVMLSLDHRSTGESGWIKALVVVPLAAILSIAIVRSAYLADLGGVTGEATLAPAVATAIFAVVNLLVYAAASLLSFMAHDSHAEARAELERRRNHERDAARAAADERSRRIELRAREERDAEQKREAEERRRREEPIRTAETLQRHIAQTRMRVDELWALREGRRNVYAARAAAVREHHQRLMSVYAAANHRTRGDGTLPEVLRELPTIDVPKTSCTWNGRSPVDVSGNGSGMRPGVEISR
jgi:hypothetical protein